MVDVLVQLLVTACGFGGVEITSTEDVLIRSGEVERGGDKIKISMRNELRLISIESSESAQRQLGLLTFMLIESPRRV